MNNEWITDRPPTAEDAGPGGIVWTTYNGRVVPWSYDGVAEGTPWMPVVTPEPYVKPKRFEVEEDDNVYTVTEKLRQVTWATVPVRDDNYQRAKEAAKRIAAIYEEMMA